VRVVADRVTTVTADGDAFTVQLQQAGRMTFSRLILATGVADQFPSVSRFFDHYGRSVFHCPSCDGYETRGEPVVVIGWSPDIAGFAAGLLEWASSVTVVTDGRRFEGDSRHRRHLGDLGVAVLTDEVVELCGERGALQAVRLRDGGLLDCSFAFFSIAHRPRNQLALDLGCEVVDEGCIVVDDEGRTSVPGVYAAGDVTPGLQYVQVAAADGARAGTACALSLRDEALGLGATERPFMHAQLEAALIRTQGEDRLAGWQLGLGHRTGQRPAVQCRQDVVAVVGGHRRHRGRLHHPQVPPLPVVQPRPNPG
jgi:thioredoxin reductase